MTARIRALRESRGWTQQDLAVRAGVTRQLIGAVEVGRHAPNVDAALALAAALGESVESLFAADRPVSTPVPVVGDKLPTPGTSATVVRIGTRTVIAPIHHGVEGSERWAVADATMTAAGVSIFDDAKPDALLVCGCDPALGVLAGLVERVSVHRVVTVHASTGESIQALGAGRAHAALVHAPPGQLPEPPVPVRRYRFARWQVGLASGRAAGVPSVDELAERRSRVVQRDAGAGSQQALSRALERIGSSRPLPGPVAEGHVDVARRVAAGAAVGVTMEAAARSFALGFAPLEEHAVELWVDARWSSLPAAVAMVDVLNGTGLRTRLGLIGGYELSECGTELVAG